MKAKTYKITFMADLTEDDVRAMKKCFFDAMNESMDIHELWELKLEEVDFSNGEEADFERRSKSAVEKLMPECITHISQVKKLFEACVCKNDVDYVIERLPNMFGRFTVEYGTEDEGFVVTNTYFDDQLDEEYEEDYEFDYPDNWEDDHEEE